MSKHTPGPWRVIEDRVPGALEIYAEEKAIAELWRRSSTQEEMANARLIAAAPKLLKALEKMLRCFSDYDGTHGDLENSATDEARAAIAKARGQA